MHEKAPTRGERRQDTPLYRSKLAVNHIDESQKHHNDALRITAELLEKVTIDTDKQFLRKLQTVLIKNARQGNFLTRPFFTEIVDDRFSQSIHAYNNSFAWGNFEEAFYHVEEMEELFCDGYGSIITAKNTVREILDRRKKLIDLTT
ncbi:unnamed protein product [Caenorhabditis auriculariae]|uniref:Uncharacterized protein n=1 Tax=Caenorhabditis auriculariae TaxID=2777116 RepID=A0A8S1HJ51_9PELO|nr:unnamed protein product [Caenorhabditis auriculariae]